MSRRGAGHPHRPVFLVLSVYSMCADECAKRRKDEALTCPYAAFSIIKTEGVR